MSWFKIKVKVDSTNLQCPHVSSVSPLLLSGHTYEQFVLLETNEHQPQIKCQNQDVHKNSSEKQKEEQTFNSC